MIENTHKNTLQAQPTELSLQEKSEIVIQERIQKWKERKTTTHLDFSYHEKPNGHVEPKFDDATLTRQKIDTYQSTIFSTTGSTSENYNRLLLGQTLAGFFKDETCDAAYVATAIQEVLLSMNPKDEHEGMLYSQLLVLNNQSMHYMARAAMSDQTPQGIDTNINRAEKLIRLWNETLETLNQYRRKNEQ